MHEPSPTIAHVNNVTAPAAASPSRSPHRRRWWIGLGIFAVLPAVFVLLFD
ncbi:AsmA protein [Xanthomonas oryzae pv. oryzae]|uniref:AsmA family membrane protein n=1 Tax=Xanthomonas oryzae pv. oryzae (strain KACC10331 / KXO85) TaxID=291331 RepID=Q5H1V4_XANOR|nr:hypothetical protein [Xanthomonas oryzae]AAW75067.1 conserved hypothetical protein [Xanthomonas oryzae pv. oryzae KACC 10331]AWK18109.1 AsmA protein [Xanthomonas oryzae pv. oryzae]AXM09441.1 AsmA protein [Xanthomonas oryzae pv. oryzae]AXM13209.1 AsmA protein [Xanthomonas oryzae pv. oryzae]AXM16939.1 AsmA protein [Xanthomonas oryzae pv. oryzae]